MQQLSAVDVAFCKMWARRMTRDGYSAEVVLDAIVDRANKPDTIDLTDKAVEDFRRRQPWWVTQ